VLVLSGITMGFGMLAFSGYFQRSSGKLAAQIFARDLTLARSTAVKTQETVVIRFYESSLWYIVEALDSDTEILRRSFGTNADIDLSAIDLQFVGDSVTFNPRGVADLSGAAGALGVAQFSLGAIVYKVSFNSMGASKVEEN
jgi:Tfp pilus assembly protein FimT